MHRCARRRAQRRYFAAANSQKTGVVQAGARISGRKVRAGRILASREKGGKHQYDALPSRARRGVARDRQVASLLTRRGNVVEVSGPNAIVSANSPYRISCNTMLGIDVKFGCGDDAVTVPIVGVSMRASPFFSGIDLHVPTDHAPDLPVDVESIAANRLMPTLCRRVSDRVQSIMSGPLRSTTQ